MRQEIFRGQIREQINEQRNRVYFLVFLAVVVGLAAWGLQVKNAGGTADPGFANYSMNIADESSDLEVNAVREADAINSGAFQPYIVGKSVDLEEN